MKRLIHRLLARAGLHVERHRDPYADLARLAGSDVHTVIDGGAFHGGASREFLSLFPKATVHAFEPTPDLAARLTNEIGRHERCEVHAAALSDVVGEAQFHVTSEGFTSSLLDPGTSFGNALTITVPVTTLDAFGKSPDVLKLDLQGAELAALRGAVTALRSTRFVLCEVNFIARYKDCALFGEVARFLEGAGFGLYRLYEIHSDNAGRWQFADALFARF
jgi:FkbM family methyltransferase